MYISEQVIMHRDIIMLVCVSENVSMLICLIYFLPMPCASWHLVSEPRATAVNVWSTNYWTAREFPYDILKAHLTLKQQRFEQCRST